MKRCLFPILAAAALALLAVACEFPTASPPAPTPDALELSVTPRVEGLSLSWRDPPGAGLHHIEISYAPGGPAKPIRISTNVGRAVILNLDPETEYAVTVKAVSNEGAASAGLSLRSRPLSAAGDDERPPDVSDVAAAPGFGKASITWSSPDLSDVADILVYRSPGGADPAVLNYYETSYSEAGLSNGSLYTYAVKTRDAAGNVSVGVAVAVLPSAAIDSTPPEFVSLTYSPSIARVGDTVALIARVRDPESAFSLSIDSDGDGAFDDPGDFAPLQAGTYLVKARAESDGGASYASTEIVVSPGAAPAIVHSGTYLIEGAGAAAAIAALASEGATVVAGDLHIRNTSLRDLRGLEKLRSVAGTVFIYGNPLLSDLAGVGNLSEVSGDLYFFDGAGTGNDSLVSLDGLGLSAVRGTLRICWCPRLADISALRSLTSVGGLVIENDHALASLRGLEGLACQTDSRLSIRYNPVLQDLRALQGFSFQGMDISYNASLVSLEGLQGLRSDWDIPYTLDTYVAYNPRLASLGAILDGKRISGEVYITNNDSLSSLEGLSAADMPSSTLYIASNPALRDCSALSTVRELRQLEIYDNQSLADLDGLSGLRRVNQNVYVRRNRALVDVSGLNPAYIGGNLELEDNESLVAAAGLGAGLLRGNLALIGNSKLASLAGMRLLGLDGSLVISDDPALSDLAGLECLAADGEIGSLTIQDCPALVSLDGLEGLYRVSGVSGTAVTIQRNRTLTSLSGLDSLASVRGAFYIFDNDLLADLGALAELRLQDGDLDLRGNASLKSLSGLSGLTISDGYLKLGDRSVWPGAYVESLDGLASLRLDRAGVRLENCAFLGSISALGTALDPASIGTGFYAYNADRIPSLSPLGSLYIGTMSDLYLENCDLIADLSPFAGVTSFAGSVDLVDLPRLSTLAGLGNVASIQGHLQLSGLPLVTTLSTLEDLTYVGQWIRINEDDALTKLDMTRLQSVGTAGYTYWDGDTSVFFITRNDRLANLMDDPASGLGLDALTSVGWSGFLVAWNAVLPQSETDDLRSKFGDVLVW